MIRMHNVFKGLARGVLWVSLLATPLAIAGPKEDAKKLVDAYLNADSPESRTKAARELSMAAQKGGILPLIDGQEMPSPAERALGNAVQSEMKKRSAAIEKAKSQTTFQKAQGADKRVMVKKGDPDSVYYTAKPGKEKSLRAEAEKAKAILEASKAEAKKLGLPPPKHLALDWQEVSGADRINGKFTLKTANAELGNLESVISQQKLSPAQRLDVAAQVAAAVGELHRGGFKHGDLKPDNFLVGYEKGADGKPIMDSEGKPKLLVTLSDVGKATPINAKDGAKKGVVAAIVDRFKSGKGNTRFRAPEGAGTVEAETASTLKIVRRVVEEGVLDPSGMPLIDAGEARKKAGAKGARRGFELFANESPDFIARDEKGKVAKIRSGLKRVGEALVARSPEAIAAEVETTRKYDRALIAKLKEASPELGDRYDKLARVLDQGLEAPDKRPNLKNVADGLSEIAASAQPERLASDKRVAQAKSKLDAERQAAAERVALKKIESGEITVSAEQLKAARNASGEAKGLEESAKKAERLHREARENGSPQSVLDATESAAKEARAKAETAKAKSLELNRAIPLSEKSKAALENKPQSKAQADAEVAAANERMGIKDTSKRGDPSEKKNSKLAQFQLNTETRKPSVDEADPRDIALKKAEQAGKRAEADAKKRAQAASVDTADSVADRRSQLARERSIALGEVSGQLAQVKTNAATPQSDVGAAAEASETRARAGAMRNQSRSIAEDVSAALEQNAQRQAAARQQARASQNANRPNADVGEGGLAADASRPRSPSSRMNPPPKMAIGSNAQVGGPGANPIKAPSAPNAIAGGAKGTKVSTMLRNAAAKVREASANADAAAVRLGNKIAAKKGSIADALAPASVKAAMARAKAATSGPDAAAQALGAKIAAKKASLSKSIQETAAKIKAATSLKKTNVSAGLDSASSSLKASAKSQKAASTTRKQQAMTSLKNFATNAASGAKKIFIKPKKPGG